jgi:hypothetical protein
VIGGYAVGFYGYPRSTGDIDIWVKQDLANAKKIISVLKQFGFPTEKISENLFLQDKQIIRMGIPPLRIELFTWIPGVTFEDCYPNQIQSTLEEGMTIPWISLADLKKNKKASGRHKDLDDLEHL